MFDYEAISDAAWNRAGCACVVISAIVAVALLVGFIATRAHAADNPLCSYFDAIATYSGVTTAEWVGYPTGWKDMPSEWDYETFTDLVGGGGILTRVSGQTRWLWGFRSLTTWTDSEGNHDGHHDFCDAVLIIDQ